MKTKKLTEEQINYNVYNALNLFCEELGEMYINNQFNPFDYNFILSEEFVIDRFVNQNNAPKEINEPDFISGGINETKTAFENSVNNCNLMLAEIENLLQDPTLPDNKKEELKKLKLYLLCRIQLLNSSIKKLKKDKNTLKMYTLVQSLDWKNAEIFEESYKQIFNVNIAIASYLNLTAKYTKKVALESKALREKAQAIIRSSHNMNQEIKTEKIEKDNALEKTEINKTKDYVKSQKAPKAKSVKPNSKSTTINKETERDM